MAEIFAEKAEGMKKRILIVDDEAAIARAVNEYLKNEGFDVEIARGGAEGFREAALKPYDLVIMDIRMPGWNGSEVIRALRLVNSEVKIIVHSGYVEEFEQDPEHPVDAVLAKPVSLKTLADTIRGLL
jgi:DNA-binding response OmpR family regulator